MTAAAARLTAALAGRAVLAPVTTRLPEQLARVRLPGPPGRFAVAANGGVLLVDGVADRGWQARIAAMAAGTASLSDVLTYVRQHCSHQPGRCRSARPAGCSATPCWRGGRAGRLRRRGRAVGRPARAGRCRRRAASCTGLRAGSPRPRRSARWPTGSRPGWCWQRGTRCWTGTCCAWPTGASTRRTGSCSPAAGRRRGVECTGRPACWPARRSWSGSPPGWPNSAAGRAAADTAIS